MAQELNEILVTLFKNPDGMTLSVSPNFTSGGKKVNFSFKGASTHCNMKAFVDGIGAMSDPHLQNFFEEQKHIWRPRVKACVAQGWECWLSKGYQSTGKGHKGKTVPATAFLVDARGGYYTLQLQLGPHWYECDLEETAVSERQREMNAIAGHRWRKNLGDDTYDLGFLG